jgi:hypothetical protein
MDDRPTCTHPLHPIGELGAVTKETDKATYRERTCPVCGGLQGIARTPKKG